MVLKRISRDEMLMATAEVIAQRGTCDRLQVGAVFSRDGRIISTGYNGAPGGLPHCNHTGRLIWDMTQDEQAVIEEWLIVPGKIMEIPAEPMIGGCQTAEHAERNAIAYAARYGVALDQSELHVTHAPCLACARSTINAGVIRVTYRTPYRLTEGIELLIQAGVEVIQFIEN